MLLDDMGTSDKEIDSASEDDLQFYSTRGSDSSLNWLVNPLLFTCFYLLLLRFCLYLFLKPCVIALFQNLFLSDCR